MKVSKLTGGQLDYWTARAEGVPADQLGIRRVPRTDWLHVCTVPDLAVGDLTTRHVGAEVQRHSTDWAQGGPLIEREVSGLHKSATWGAVAGPCARMNGDTPLQAVCRAVVYAAFGDEVDEVPVQPA